MSQTPSLVVIETHPIQYHAPVYRVLQQQHGIPVTAIYGSDFSVSGYHDQEFGTTFAWDTDLLSGYRSIFLSRIASSGASATGKIPARGLAAALRQACPAAILLTGYSPSFYRTAIWHASRSGVPLLFRAETADHARQRSSLKHLLRDRLLTWFYDRCAALLYIGQRSREHYQRLGCWDERLFFAPYCVDDSVFRTDEDDRSRLREALRQQHAIAPDQLVILFSGKLVPRKQPELLLQAIKSLPDRIRQRIHIIFLGDGALHNRLKQLAAATPIVYTQIAGFQNQRALSQYYHAADLLALPSASDETWGLVVNEALHHGLPCIVSDMVGCAPDLVEPGITGEVFRAGSAQSLATMLIRAINLIGRPEVRQQCRQKVGNYTVECAALGIATGYQRVLQSTRISQTLHL
jgi:glycosyltransferase involved in cell wall biosynthesis